jgi:hypothetical protein
MDLSGLEWTFFVKKGIDGIWESGVREFGLPLLKGTPTC